MAYFYINRRLKLGDKDLSEIEVLEHGPVLVILAEPGAGKTELLAEFGRLLGVVPVRASRFRHQTHLSADAPRIIDALDEVAKIDESSVDQIIVKAQEFSNGRVIFASRSSEWQEARTKWIRECFGSEPHIVRIEHFTSGEQRLLFERHLPEEDFNAFANEVDRFELTPLLGNPQFQVLFEDAYMQSGRRFTSKIQIFHDAVERLAIEAGNTVAGRPRPPSSDLIALSSEIIAKLLLAGASGVSAKEQLSDFDYPYLAALVAGNAETAFAVLDTRLFKPGIETDHHEPVHRIVAEYCAAQYIVRRVSDPQNPLSLRRALAVIAPNGAVRDELRGMLGWMASLGNERIQRAAIELDAYAVIANGDPSQLTSPSKKLLLKELSSVAASNPGFRRGDYWRRFSVSGFFSDDLAADVARILQSSAATSPLTDLLLELLVDSGGPISLLDDVRSILLNPGAGLHTRLWAARAARKLSGIMSVADFDALVLEGAPASLGVAIDLLSEVDVNEVDLDAIERLLRAYVRNHQSGRRSRDDSSHMAFYHLKYILDLLEPEKAADLLDRLTKGLACTCGHSEYDCRCRGGVSKVAGGLLDRYFSAAEGPHDPDRVWGWTKTLWYRNRGDTDKSAAIKAMIADSSLRHQLHLRAFSGVTTADDAWDVYFRLMDSHHHSGLRLYEGDEWRIADFAFETGYPGLWSAFWRRPATRTSNQRPDEFRRHLRKQAAAKPAFAAEWARLERRFRTVRLEQERSWRRRHRHRDRREEQRSAQDRADLKANRANVESGNHWLWIRRFADLYFLDRDRLAQYTTDTTLVDNALRNALPLITPYVPTIHELARNGHRTVAQVAFVSCWIQFRDRGSLEHVDRAILLAATVQAHHYQTMPKDEYDAFRQELDRQLFSVPGEAEDFARNFIEPSLSGGRNGHSNIGWLTSQKSLAHLQPTLSIEWLRRLPEMPVQSRDVLFNIAAATSDRAVLIEIINQAVSAASSEPLGESEEELQHRMDDLRFWQLRRFFFETPAEDGWDELKVDPDTIFRIANRAGRFGDKAAGWPVLSSDKIFKVLDGFVDHWPAVHLPSSHGTDDPPEEIAFRFLTEIIWSIGRDSPERALPVLERLIADPRFLGFIGALRTLRAETIKKLALSDFHTPEPGEIVQMLDSAAIASVEDLRAFAVEELGWLQNWLKTADTDPLASFYQRGAHVDENTARNRVVDSLQWRITAMNMPVVIEHHMSDANRCDFTVSTSINGKRRLLVVEAKGQWHPRLYTAATAQLSEQYASHHDAEQQGIYLVFWFGPETTVAGRVQHRIKTAAELQERIVLELPQDLRGLIDVVVLDLAWSGATTMKLKDA
jgi:hypothetical protein